MVLNLSEFESRNVISHPIVSSRCPSFNLTFRTDAFEGQRQNGRFLVQSYRKAVAAGRRDKKQNKPAGLTDEQKSEIRFAATKLVAVSLSLNLV